MERKEWITLKRLKDEDDFKKVLVVGERFLYGPKMIEQVVQQGEKIWYYQVIKIDKTVEYMPVFDILEKDHEVPDFTKEEN
jgi:hypothetical protein